MDREDIVTEPRDLVGRPAGQHIDDVGGAEPLAGPDDRFNRLARRLRAVGHGRRVEADIAVAASVRALAEVAQERPAPALHGLAIGQQRIEPAAVHALAVLAGSAVLDEAPPHADVVETVEQRGVGGRAVAPGPAEFLIVGLDRGGQVDVDDIAHVRLVDPHAEGDGRGHHDPGLGEEAIEQHPPGAGLETGMVGQRLVAGPGENGGHLLGPSPGDGK